MIPDQVNYLHAGTVSTVYATFADAACSPNDDAECMLDRTSSVLLFFDIDISAEARTHFVIVLADRDSSPTVNHK